MLLLLRNSAAAAQAGARSYLGWWLGGFGAVVAADTGIGATFVMLGMGATIYRAGRSN